MQFSEFCSIVENCRKNNPDWFDFQDKEPCPTEEDFFDAEKVLGVSLPLDYKEFLRVFGGGYFVFTNVFSVLPGSDWNIIERQGSKLPNGFLAVSDDEAGGLYGFLYRADGSCDPGVFYIYLSGWGDIVEKKFDSFFDYLNIAGLHG